MLESAPTILGLKYPDESIPTPENTPPTPNGLANTVSGIWFKQILEKGVVNAGCGIACTITESEVESAHPNWSVYLN